MNSILKILLWDIKKYIMNKDDKNYIKSDIFYAAKTEIVNPAGVDSDYNRTKIKLLTSASIRFFLAEEIYNLITTAISKSDNVVVTKILEYWDDAFERFLKKASQVISDEHVAWLKKRLEEIKLSIEF